MNKTRQIIKFLATGKDLTTSQVRSMFDITNVGGAMSRVRKTAEQYGNWRIVSTPLKNGNGMRFSMKRVILANPTVNASTLESSLA